MKTTKPFTYHETIIGLLLILALASACTALPPTPTQPIAPRETPAPTPTLAAPPPTPTHTPAPPAAAELKATVEAGLMPTPTPNASGWSPASINQVGVLPLVSEGGRPLWAVYSFGNRYSEANQYHFVAIYAHNDAGWQELARLWPDLDIQPQDSGAASTADLNGDGALEIVLEASGPYVFCLACGVRQIAFQVYTWDSANQRMSAVDLRPLSMSQPQPLRGAVNRAVELAQAGLWQDAFIQIIQAKELLPQYPEADTRTLDWDYALIELHAEAMARQVAESQYPLLSNVLYGDYAAALDVMRSCEPERLFDSDSPLIVGTVAEGWAGTLRDWIARSTTQALAVRPDLAAAYFLRGWATYLADSGNPQAVADVERAAELAPGEPLFAQVNPQDLKARARNVNITPAILALPAGASGRYRVSVTSLTPQWSGISASWSVSDLPPGVTANTYGQMGNGLQIDTSGSIPEGTYAFGVTATIPGSVLETQAALRILPCYESFGTGSFTRSLAENAVPHKRAGPSTTNYGIASPLLQFCNSPERRVMWIVSEQSPPYGWPANIILYRYREWPPDTSMIGDGHIVDNVESVALSYGRTLTWKVTPGVYLVYFPTGLGGMYDPKASKLSITYRVEIETSP